jgi:hypothetical protein
MEFDASQMTAEIFSPEVTWIPKEPGCTDEDLSRKGGWEGLSKSAEAADKCVKQSRRSSVAIENRRLSTCLQLVLQLRELQL